MAYIGLDIGTSVCKASIITKEGKLLQQHIQNIALNFLKGIC